MIIVIALKGSRGIEWETRQSSTLHFANRRKQLHALRGVDGQGVLHGPPGRHWSNRRHGFALTSCGEVIDPVILRSRLNPIPSLLHVVKQRKYAQRVDQGESDGQDRNGHGNDMQPGD